MSASAGAGRRLLSGLIVAHRWAGILFAPVLFVWFASGMVMLFHQMPEVTEADELALLGPIDAARVRINPSDLAQAGIWRDASSDLTLRMLGAEPVYEHVGPGVSGLVSADTGRPVPPLDRAAAETLVRELFGDTAAGAHAVATLEQPDQWTFSTPPARLGPLHQVAVGDEAGTMVYVAARSGRVVMRTTRASRTWAWVGVIPHWWYIRALRAHPALWGPLVIYGALAGTLTALAGVVVGINRLSWSRRYFGGRSRSPYLGWLRWHHWLGLAGGLLAVTWAFSGMLSMSPWDWSPGNAPDPDRAAAVWDAGAETRDFRLALPVLLAARPVADVRRIRTRWVLGRPYYQVEGPSGTSLMAADSETASTRQAFGADELRRAAERAVPDRPVAAADWLTAFDAYYYRATAGAGDLPVLRVRFGDAEGTTLYLRAADGELVQQDTRVTRTERWLYHGLHSLDLPGVYQHPTAWRTLVLLLLVPGLLLCATSLVIGWRRLLGRR